MAFFLLSTFLLYTDELTIKNSNLLRTLMHWSLYVVCLCFFHFLEFFSTANSQPALLSYESFVINHSPAYSIAAIASWAEFWIEYTFLSEFKYGFNFIVLGLTLIVLGQTVRTVAMWQCGEHFSHLIMEKKTAKHELVTKGLYSIFRHPAYFGFFYWSIGTQCLLCNPICVVLYTLASWKFFSKRIPYEESLLLEFYPSTYPGYVERTIIGIPFVNGPIGRPTSTKSD